jgi:hypothetical protein
MKANNPGATKIKVVGKFSTYKLFLMFKNSSNNIFGIIASSELIFNLWNLEECLASKHDQGKVLRFI